MQDGSTWKCESWSLDQNLLQDYFDCKHTLQLPAIENSKLTQDNELVDGFYPSLEKKPKVVVQKTTGNDLLAKCTYHRQNVSFEGPPVDRREWKRAASMNWRGNLSIGFNRTNSQNKHQNSHQNGDSLPVSLKELLDKYLREINIRLEKEQEECKEVGPRLKSGWFRYMCGAPVEDGRVLVNCLKKIEVASHQQGVFLLERHQRHIQMLRQFLVLRKRRTSRMALGDETSWSHREEMEISQLMETQGVEDYLEMDIAYYILKQQRFWMHELILARKNAELYVQRYIVPSVGSLDDGKNRSRLLMRLLEAASWFRLMNGVDGKSKHGISDVLRNEDYYQQYATLMLKEDWWSIAQAHFETIVFHMKSKIGMEIEKCTMTLLNADASDDTSSRRSSVSSTMSANGLSPIPKNASPDSIIEWIAEVQELVLQEFRILPKHSTTGLHVFLQRSLFPRIGSALVCNLQEIQEKNRIWHRQQRRLRQSNPIELIGISETFQEQLKSCTKVDQGLIGTDRVYFPTVIATFSNLQSIVPCDLLQEFMHGVIVLHEEVEKVVGTKKFSVELFFPILTYCLTYCELNQVYTQLYLLEEFAITENMANGEESYYVYCLHAAVDFISNYTD